MPQVGGLERQTESQLYLLRSQDRQLQEEPALRRRSAGLQLLRLWIYRKLPRKLFVSRFLAKLHLSYPY